MVSDKGKFWYRALLIVAVLSSLINLCCRAIANKKFVPGILGKQTKDSFLAKRLNFENGDFYDFGGDIKKSVKNDLVLISGFHNLFYADFKYIHSSFAKDLSAVSYVLIQNDDLPKDIKVGSLVYQNKISGIKLYFYKGGGLEY